MSLMIDTADIAAMLGVGREYCTDRVVKRPDFPKPCLNLSRKTRRWRRADVEAWIEAQAIRAAGRSPRTSARSTHAAGSSSRGAR